MEMGPIMLPGARFARSNQQQPVSLNGQQLVHEPGDPYAVATYYENLDQHVVVTAGAWPADGKTGTAWWATLSETAATLFGLKVGDLYCLGPTGVSVRGAARGCARMAATWKPRSSAEPYWAGQALGTDLAVGRTSLFDIAAATRFVTVHAGQLYVTDLGRVHASDADSIRDHLRQLHGVYGVTSDATFITGLDAAIQTFLTRLQAQEVLAAGVEVALLAVALYAIALAAIHFMDGQKRVLGLWRGRGGAGGRAGPRLRVAGGGGAPLAVPPWGRRRCAARRSPGVWRGAAAGRPAVSRRGPGPDRVDPPGNRARPARGCRAAAAPPDRSSGLEGVRAGNAVGLVAAPARASPARAGRTPPFARRRIEPFHQRVPGNRPAQRRRPRALLDRERRADVVWLRHRPIGGRRRGVCRAGAGRVIAAVSRRGPARTV